MDWQEKWAALDALRETTINIRKPGDLYVSQRVEVGGDGCLHGKYGNGATPEEAIEDHWRQLVTELPIALYLAVDVDSDHRKHFRWNGFMWVELPLPAKSAA